MNFAFTSLPIQRFAFAFALCLLVSGCATPTPEPSAPEASASIEPVCEPPSPEDPSSTRLCVIDYPSFNFNRRTLPISLVVLHYTGGGFRESLNALTNSRGTNRVSAHYLVDENGTIFRLVEEPNRAWHAGVGRWGAITDVNSASIGIEIVNPGPLPNGRLQPFTPEQIDAVTALCLDIQSRYHIREVVGHEDVAPLRKADPGPLFPWHKLKAMGVKVRAKR